MRNRGQERMQRAWRYVDAHFKTMIGDLREVCRHPSTRDNPEGLEATRACIAAKMRRAGLSPGRCDVPGGNALVHAAAPGTSDGSVLFYNHYDVVLPGENASWSTGDPFEPAIVDGKLIARGVSDDKGPLYSRLHAVEALMADGEELPVGVKFLVEGDEESGSRSLHRFVQESPEAFRELARADACVWENGRIDAAGHPWLRMGVRGSVGFDLVVTTARADVHGRMGATIPSASWRLVWALSTLKTPVERVAIRGFYDRVIPPSAEDLEVLREFPYDEEGQRARLGIDSYLGGATGEALKRRVYLEPSVSICALEAGEPHFGVRGIVPHTARARVSFYLVADQRPQEVRRLLREHLDAHGFADVEIVGGENAHNRPVRTPVDTPFRARAIAAAKHVYEKPMVTELTQLGAGPACLFRDAWPEMPIVGFGPGNTNGNHHAPDENLIVEDYRSAVKYVIALLCSYDNDGKEAA